MTLGEFQKMIRSEADSAREAVNNILRERDKSPALVGKHEARNWQHLRSVIAEAETKCPQAADTLRWLLWWESLDADRIAFLADNIETT